MASRKQRKAKKHTQSNKNSNLAQDQVSYLCRRFPSLRRITNLFSIINIQKLLLKNGMSPYMDPEIPMAFNRSLCSSYDYDYFQRCNNIESCLI